METAARDRRWAQGNLQHARIVGATGLPWVSRLHLAMGIYGYLASVLWAASLAVGLLLAFQSAHTLPVYFPERKTLFPVWPVIDYVKAFYLLLGTMAVVLLPKMLGIALAFIRHDVAARTSGWFLLGATTETLFSILMAPILMLTHTSAVTEVVRGRDSGWSAQGRGEVDAPHGKVVRFHKWHVLLGAVTGLAAGLISPYVLAWMSPIVIGLLSAVLLSATTSRPAPVWLARALATPETLCPPPICSAVGSRYREWSQRLISRPRAVPGES
jgi:membrane glycosyltransferase